MQNIADRTKLEVFHVLKTGRPLRRTGLFKSLFKLTGISELYNGVRYTDGPHFNDSRASRTRRRAVIQVLGDARSLLNELSLMFSAFLEAPVIKLNVVENCINVNYGKVNWNKIDLAMEKLKKTKSV